MIKSGLTKTMLENEEGLTHLWLQLGPWTTARKTEKPSLPCKMKLQLVVPPGLYVKRLPASASDEGKTMFDIVPGDTECEMVFELFTTSPVPCGSRTLIISLSGTDEGGRPSRWEQELTLAIAEEDEIDEACVNADIVEKVNRIQLVADEEEQPFLNAYQQALHGLALPSTMSELERKYRIEGGYAG
ncbi:hypothetical protein [Paenibacillus pinihumi]|uniref:hypothetical protein n=1 Tax=Paenibacillus pinihumi TaxID=669462 RepID=UPI000412FE75|nr:hypothetical protein [Paenibacillus pinihumi]